VEVLVMEIVVEYDGMVGVVSALAEATTILNAVLVVRLEKIVFWVMVQITKVVVLMVCSTSRNNDGGHGRFNNGYGFNRGNNRRNFNSQGNCNNRHFNNGYTGRDGNGKGTYVAREISNVSGSEGLTTAHALLVKEVVAVFAKQLAGMLQLGVQQGSTPVHPVIPAKVTTMAIATGTEMRPEAAFLVVASLSAPQTSSAIVASPRDASGDVPLAKKNKGSTCSDVRTLPK
jgi:hypothetical protein